MASNEHDDTSSSKQRDLSSSLSELKEALKETTEREHEAAAETISTSYAKSHANQNVEIARRNLDQDPDNPMLKDWLAFNLYASGRYEEASELYRECLGGGLGNAEQHYYLGNCYYRMGGITAARAEWEAVLRIDTTSKCAMKALEKLDKVQGS